MIFLSEPGSAIGKDISLHFADITATPCSELDGLLTKHFNAGTSFPLSSICASDRKADCLVVKSRMKLPNGNVQFSLYEKLS